MSAIRNGWYFIYAIDKGDTEELIILKQPDKYKLSALNDKLEELVIENVVHPDLVKVTRLMNEYPHLAQDIYVALSAKKIEESEYDSLQVIEEISKEEVLNEISNAENVAIDYDSLEFDLI